MHPRLPFDFAERAPPFRAGGTHPSHNWSGDESDLSDPRGSCRSSSARGLAASRPHGDDVALELDGVEDARVDRALAPLVTRDETLGVLDDGRRHVHPARPLDPFEARRAVDLENLGTVGPL